MTPLVTRVLVLALVGALTALGYWLGRRYVAAKARAALRATPVSGNAPADVTILAFHTADCRQCRTMQTPALDRVLAARGALVRVREVDAIAEPDLAARFNVLTVPSTVVLDQVGQARAVNYGFANTAKLLRQVDDVTGPRFAASATAAE